MAELRTAWRDSALGMLERSIRGADILSSSNGGFRKRDGGKPVTGLTVAGQFRDYIILSYLSSQFPVISINGSISSIPDAII